MWMSSSYPNGSPAHVHEVVGRRISQRRRELGLSLEELAAQAGVSVDVLAGIEGGLPATGSILFDICGPLSVLPSWFFEPLRDTPTTE